MKNNKKALAVLTIGLCIGASLCACTTTTSYSKTTTDSEGNTITTTTTTKQAGHSDPVTTTCTTTTKANDSFNDDYDDDFDDDFFKSESCGEVAEDLDEHKVTVSIENETGEDITGLYMCTSEETSWCNLLDEGETIKDGETLDDYLDLNYSEDSMSFDSGIDVEGCDDTIAFDSLDISDVASDGFTLTFVKTANGYGWHIDASYVR